jgi:hypothetical protein
MVSTWSASLSGAVVAKGTLILEANSPHHHAQILLDTLYKFR